MAPYLDWSQYIANLVAIAATLIASIIGIEDLNKKSLNLTFVNLSQDASLHERAATD